MTDLTPFLAAAKRENTRKSHRVALDHYELTWGGWLPASNESVARYLADFAGTLSTNTLRSRLSALAFWHQQHGFHDPTKSALVKEVFKGIRALHPYQEQQAEPLQLMQLERVIERLEGDLLLAKEEGSRGHQLRILRDRALILLGFWRAFRSDQLCRLQVEHVQVVVGEGMRIYLPRSKTDKENVGTTIAMPMLARLCPVRAYQDWCDFAELSGGPVFRSINRWGNVAPRGLHINSVIPLLRRSFEVAGLSAELYSSHSLRRGFATWAASSGWDLKALMTYVGWSDQRSAVRYVDAISYDFSSLKERPSHDPLIDARLADCVTTDQTRQV